MALTILFNPKARVYNLRLLLLADFVITVLVGMSLAVVSQESVWGSCPECRTLAVTFACGVLIFIHHMLALLRCPIRGLALIDLAIVLLEAGVLCAEYADVGVWVRTPRPFDTFPVQKLWRITAVVEVAALSVSAIFRLSTISKTKEIFFCQRFAFLGCCTPLYLPYTTATILLNRSLTRPLVRGESKFIVVARALVISCLGIGMPAFGFYSIVVLPAQSEVYTKSLVDSSIIVLGKQSLDFTALTGNASAVLVPFNGIPDVTTLVDQIKVYSVLYDGSQVNCLASAEGALTSVGIICPIGWSAMTSMTISVAIAPEMGGIHLYMAPWYSKLGYVRLLTRIPGREDFTSPTPTPLLPGSRLFAYLTWSARLRVDSSLGWMYQPDIIGLQTNPSDKTDEPNIARLTLLQAGGPVRYLRDTTDASTLSGISSLGGFWTFVNGAFALLFGANIIYFAFGRRPLSALGVVHLFQQDKLVRQWHEDFPALHTEGGSPGSESAGVVAFMRERLVDIGLDPRTPDVSEEDIEAQGLSADISQSASCHELHCPPAKYLSKEAGYILEQVPVLLPL